MAKAPYQFVKDFEIVAEHYGLKDAGEYETAKQAARDDIENAVQCFAALAGEIRES